MDMFSVLTTRECKKCHGFIKRTVRIMVVGYAETLEAHCTKCGKNCIKEFYPSDD